MQRSASWSPTSRHGLRPGRIQSAAAGWWLRRWTRYRELRELIDNDQYYLPFRSVLETSATLDVSRHVALAKDRSTLVFGETGGGKTETIKLLTYQMQVSDDDPSVIFDYKGEYQKFLSDVAGRDEEDLIYLSSRSANHTRNLFAEIEHESDVDEFARLPHLRKLGDLINAG